MNNVREMEINGENKINWQYMWTVKMREKVVELDIFFLLTIIGYRLSTRVPAGSSSEGAW